MSSKIYFNTKGRVNLRRRAINVATRAYHRIAPTHARKTARNLLLTPERYSANTQAPEGLQQKVIESSEGSIMTYSLGSGPTWLLGHGWSGSASQFYTLMERIAASGFTALAFDNPAHGASEGRHGHLPGFVKGLDAVLEQAVEDLAGVVAHSMGCTMMLESKHSKLAGVPMLLVAPILNYKDNLYRVVEGSGFSLRLFQEVIRAVEQQYQYPIDRVDSHQRLAGHQGHIVIVHDTGDRFALFEQSKKANALPGVSLIETSGLGHNRILKSEPLLRAFDALSNQQTPETH